MAGNFPSNYLAGIGGAPASGVGGYIDISSNDPDENPNNEISSLDVAEWAIQEIFENAPLSCSGNLGATNARLCGYSYLYRASIVWDLNCPPDVELRGITGSELVFWLGTLQKLVASDSDVIADRFYWSPDAVIENASPMVDANGKKMDRVLITGRFRSHVFLCPEMGTPDDESTLAGAYAKWYFDGPTTPKLWVA